MSPEASRFFRAMATEQHCFFDTVFSHVLKIDQQRFIYIWILDIFKFLEFMGDF